MGFAAWMTGQALGRTWKPAWHAVVYGLLLGLGDRFLTYALFGGALSSPLGYLVDTLVLIAVALVSHRAAQAAKMVSQYPWLYQRAGPFGWRAVGDDRG
ncbi:MAG: hypothetical protein H6983_01205 [Ectothiorhodospiraceae bacterium]|nr:hypothetical protein [Ectothiorhodospiraceae bacterium]